MKTIGESEILHLLSESLKEEIFIYTRGSLLSTCLVLTKFSSYFNVQISKLLEVHTFAPSDIIFEEGEKSSSMYFIRTGEIELFQQSTGTILKVLKNGKYCGEIALFCRTPRCCSAKSIDFLECLILEQKCFESILEKNPEALRIYDYMINKCNKGDLSALDIHCYLCAKMGHVATSCKEFHLDINDDILKTRWIKSRSQATKYVNPYNLKHAFTQKKHKNDLKKYNVSNVVGTERDLTKIFRTDEELSQKISHYQGLNEYLTVDGNELNQSMQGTIRKFPSWPSQITDESSENAIFKF